MAIDDLLDEHEQSERVLAWLRSNGAGLIGGIVLGLAAIGGWKWWESRDLQLKAGQADRYQVALSAIESKDKAAADKVKALGAGTYGNLAALELAKAQVEAGQRDAAIATLRTIKSDDLATASVANERLARLLIDAKQADAAVKLLATASSAGELETRGDAQYALGQQEQARTSYQQALGKLDVGSQRRRLLELKLIEVGGKPASTEAKS